MHITVISVNLLWNHLFCIKRHWKMSLDSLSVVFCCKSWRVRIEWEFRKPVCIQSLKSTHRVFGGFRNTLISGSPANISQRLNIQRSRSSDQAITSSAGQPRPSRASANPIRESWQPQRSVQPSIGIKSEARAPPKISSLSLLERKWDKCIPAGKNSSSGDLQEKLKKSLSFVFLKCL